MRSPQEFADILEQHNRWRRGEEIKPTDPALLGQAIDAAVAALRAGQAKAEDPVQNAKRRLKAPWPDFAGNDIYEGDVIQHPNGDRGEVVLVPVVFPQDPDSTIQWRVNYANGESMWLGNQIGDKGQAVVVKSGEASEDYFTPPEWMTRIISAVRRATEEPDMDVVVAVEEVERFEEHVIVRAGGSKFMFSSEALSKFFFDAGRTAHIACVVAKGLKGKECSNA